MSTYRLKSSPPVGPIYNLFVGGAGFLVSQMPGCNPVMICSFLTTFSSLLRRILAILKYYFMSSAVKILMVLTSMRST